MPLVVRLDPGNASFVEYLMFGDSGVSGSLVGAEVTTTLSASGALTISGTATASVASELIATGFTGAYVGEVSVAVDTSVTASGTLSMSGRTEFVIEIATTLDSSGIQTLAGVGVASVEISTELSGGTSTASIVGQAILVTDELSLVATGTGNIEGTFSGDVVVSLSGQATLVMTGTVDKEIDVTANFNGWAGYTVAPVLDRHGPMYRVRSPIRRRAPY